MELAKVSIVDELKGLKFLEIVEPTGKKQVKARLKKESLPELCENIMSMGFDHCSCISAVDYPDHFTIVYSFWSTARKCGIDAYVETEKGGLVPSISGYYGGADWHEREAFDLMGVVFSGHPNLKRILLSEDVEYHPLRKEFRHPFDRED